MKTNTIKTTFAAAAVASIALIAMAKDPASMLSTMAVITSYAAVALLVGLVTMDYRIGPKAYSAS